MKYLLLIFELLLSFNSKQEYDMWVNNNKQKIINKLKEENFNVLINIFKTIARLAETTTGAASGVYKY